MKAVLIRFLKEHNRPYGEYIPGGDAVPDGEVDEQIKMVKTLKIKGKTVITPDGTSYGKKSVKTKKTNKKKKALP